MAEDAKAALEVFAEKWDETYPAISQIWLLQWENIIYIFRLPNGYQAGYPYHSHIDGVYPRL
jgi:transposase-like protein